MNVMSGTVAIRIAVAASLSGCASNPPPGAVVLHGYPIQRVRPAARAAVKDVAHPHSVVRITEEGNILTEGHIGVCGEHVTCAQSTLYGPLGTPWTTIEVHMVDHGLDTELGVEVDYEYCGPPARCQPQKLASTGALEREIIERTREHLESDE